MCEPEGCAGAGGAVKGEALRARACGATPDCAHARAGERPYIRGALSARANDTT